MVPGRLESMLAECGLDTDGLDQLEGALRPLAALGEGTPVPSPQLAALFGEGAGRSSERALPTASPLPTGHPRRRRTAGRAAVSTLVLALSGVGATGLSAAANELPSPWQHQASLFSRHHLPFDFPEPTARPRGRDGVLPPVDTAGSRARPRSARPTPSSVPPRAALAAEQSSPARGAAEVSRSAQARPARAATPAGVGPSAREPRTEKPPVDEPRAENESPAEVAEDGPVKGRKGTDRPRLDEPAESGHQHDEPRARGQQARSPGA